MIRIDSDDEVYRTAKEKYNAIINVIGDCAQRGQPILVGTVSIEKSETLSEMLKPHKIPHQVLNARFHEQEAHIIAQAGVPGAVTIATNMAGRGTDIQLGGNATMRLSDWIAARKQWANAVPRGDRGGAPKINADVEEKKQKSLGAGGLYVLGTERHESRRIDNQLRGRSGRQGDPGASKFYLSLEDDLMRIFGAERMDSVLRKLGIKEDEAIAHPWINRALENAQQEGRSAQLRHAQERAQVRRRDERSAQGVFEQRIGLMQDETVEDTVSDMRQEVVQELVAAHIPAKAFAEQWDVTGLREEVKTIFGVDAPVEEWAAEEGIADREIRSGCRIWPTRRLRARRRNSARRPCAKSRKPFCCRRSTISGASIW